MRRQALDQQKKIVLSGVQPTSIPHLGNYLGAIRNWIDLQNSHQCFFLIVDLHAITINQDPEKLRQNTYEILAFYLAAGLSPEKSALFVQSHIHQHTELAWALTCMTYMGELNRMTQFKDKSSKSGQNIGAGLFTYPVLMASDILLYQPNFIPVGADQKQHVELTRNLAERVNNRFKEDIFQIPQPLIQDVGARVMDLQAPESKMSKSGQNPKGIIYMNETNKQISKKIKSAVTDSGSEVQAYDQASAGIKSLIDIYSALSCQSATVTAEQFLGKSYGTLKVATADLAVEKIAPIRDRTAELLQNRDYLDQVLKAGADKAREKAQLTLSKVYDTLGFIKPR